MRPTIAVIVTVTVKVAQAVARKWDGRAILYGARSFPAGSSSLLFLLLVVTNERYKGNFIEFNMISWKSEQTKNLSMTRQRTFVSITSTVLQIDTIDCFGQAWKAESWLAGTYRANMIRFIYVYLFTNPKASKLKQALRWVSYQLWANFPRLTGQHSNATLMMSPPRCVKSALVIRENYHEHDTKHMASIHPWHNNIYIPNNGLRLAYLTRAKRVSGWPPSIGTRLVFAG